MGKELSKARQKLASQILKDFKGKITGDNSDFVVDENPENVFFVGKLLSNKSNSNKSGYNSDVFIESVGMDFYVEEHEFNNAKLCIYPKGDFYYRVYPTLDQQRHAFLDEINSRFEKDFLDFETLVDEYKKNPVDIKFRRRFCGKISESDTSVAGGRACQNQFYPFKCSAIRIAVKFERKIFR